MEHSTAAPFADLTPDLVLDALTDAGLAPDGRLLALNSYENRVYQIGIEDGPPVVAKFYRPQRWSDEAILEEHRFTGELADAELPVVAPLRLKEASLHRFGDFRFAVYDRRGGRAPELDNDHTLEWMGRFVGRMHAVGAQAAFVARPRLSVERYGSEPFDWLLQSNFIPPELRAAWQGTVERALASVRACFDRAGDVSFLRIHGDCHGGNVLWTEAGPHFVDFDDCCSGPALQDLWLLLSGERASMQRQLALILRGYERFHSFDRRELHLLEALRTLRLIHYCAWIARRWDDPAFPAAFSWFDTPRYWQDRILELKEQIALMDEAPLAPDGLL